MEREFCKFKTGFKKVKQAGRQCKGRKPRNFDFLQLTLNAHCVSRITVFGAWFFACVIGWHREHFLGGDIVAVGREGGREGEPRYEIKGSFFIPPIIHRPQDLASSSACYYMAKAGVARR